MKRPDRALAYLDDPDVGRLDQPGRIELWIVLAGARRDLGQTGAAVLLLQPLARATAARHPWAIRLWYAHADALLADGRPDEAREWFRRVAELDSEADTDADERLLELDGVVVDELGSDNEGVEDDDSVAPELSGAELAALVRDVTSAGAAAPSDPPGPRGPASRVREQATGPAPRDAAPGSGPAFTDDAPAAETTVRGGVPAVAFAAPPESAPVEQEEPEQRAPADDACDQ